VACEDAITFDDTLEFAGVGESCEELSCDYAAGLYCDWDAPEGVCPVCKAGARVGEPCSNYPYVGCDRDGYCDEATGQCAALKSVGMSCTETFQCQWEFYCKDGLCSAPLGRDQPCTPVTDYCDGFLACRGGVCTDRGTPGEACAPDPWPDARCVAGATCHRGFCRVFDLCADGEIGQPCAYACVEGAYCHPDNGECTALEAVGQPCLSWEACVEESYCATDGVCTTYAQAGESCEERYCADGTVCVWDTSLTCIEPLASGEDCPDDWWCASTYCDPSSSKCADEPPCTMP
jgi:hypothetical protein